MRLRKKFGVVVFSFVLFLSSGCSVFMAAKAGSFFVLAQKSVFGCIVVELGVQPFDGLVTGSTIRSHLILMGFVFGMAVDALRFYLSMLFIPGMAIAALGIIMGAEQFKISERVVEAFLIQKDNNRIAPFVLGMA